MAIIQNKPNMNYGVWGSNGNIAVPTSEKVDLGWIIERPPNEVMNWLQNRQDSMLQFVNQRGIPTWDSLTEYPLNAYVVRNGTLYRAVSQNIDKDPTLNSAIWNVAFATYTDYSNLYNDVQKIKNEDGYLENYVSKQNPVMLGESKGIAYKNTTGASGLSFTGNTPQIENDGQVVATFSGAQLMTDVVTREEVLELLKIKIGALYLTTVATNPSTTLGYGTWEKYAQGDALVGHSDSVTSSTPDWIKFAGTRYGSYTHSLTEDQNGSHEHLLITGGSDGTAQNLNGGALHNANGTNVRTNYSPTKTTVSGEGSPHNNVQPSIVVFIWRRTA